MKNIKQTISTIHRLLNDFPTNSKKHRYGLYAFSLMNILATLLNLGVLYGIFYLYLQDRIDLALCFIALFASVLFRLFASYIKIHHQSVTMEKLNFIVTQQAFTHVLTKQAVDYNKSTFRIEQLSNRVSRCLVSYFELFANLSLFLIVFVLMLFKSVLILTLLGYIVLVAVLFRWLNRHKEKTENLWDDSRFKRRHFINDITQLKDTLTAIGQIQDVPEKFAKVNEDFHQLQRKVKEITLNKNAVIEIVTICYLIACFLLWTLMYDKEQVLSLLAIMVLLTAQLFPKAINVLRHYHEMQDNFAFVEQYFELKQQAIEETYQGSGTLHYDEQFFSISNLTLGYDERQLFDRANIKLPTRGHFILKAPNGSGKSTLLKWIVAQMADMPHKAYYIPQQLHVYHGSILENIKLFADEYNEEKIQQALALSGFDEVMAKKGYALTSVIHHQELSGGEKTKLVLASLLYYRDRVAVVLIDEVTASLDAESTQYFYHILARTMTDKLVIEITHETNDGNNPQYIEISDYQLVNNWTKINTIL